MMATALIVACVSIIVEFMMVYYDTVLSHRAYLIYCNDQTDLKFDYDVFQAVYRTSVILFWTYQFLNYTVHILFVMKYWVIANKIRELESGKVPRIKVENKVRFVLVLLFVYLIIMIGLIFNFAWSYEKYNSDGRKR